MDLEMNLEVVRNLGPLAPLVGVWEGDKGDDTAPSDDRNVEHNKYRERIHFEVISQVHNHEQSLWGLRYSTKAWRLGEAEPFHEEVGYWLWDPAAKQVLRCFIVPRGVSVLAGGTAEPTAKQFELNADAGSSTYGICSNKFLENEFKTVHYTLQVTIHSNDSWSYKENTQLHIKGRQELFDHKDQNTLQRAK
jgi:hypothetical protein